MGAFALAVLLQSATPLQTITPAPARYRVVLVDGTEYAAREPFKVKGKIAVFTLLPSGQVVSIPLDTINQQATRAANAAPLELAKPTPRKARTRIVLSGAPRPLETPRQAPADFPGLMTFAGRGHEVTTLFSLSPGLYVFRLKHSGERNFIVDLLNETGRQIENLSNEIGDFSGSKAVRIERAGRYLFNVRADGDWSIAVERPN